MSRNLAELLRSAAKRYPDRCAVRGVECQWTYSELDRASDHLAGTLINAQVAVGDRVGVLASKSFETVAGIYAVLKCGAAYVPLDFTAPPARTSTIIRACGIRHLVVNSAGQRALEKLPEDIRRSVQAIDGLSGSTTWHDVGEWPIPTLPATFGENSLAYILYTSGSTGVPKGIMHTHGSALAFIDWAQQVLAPTCEDRFSSHAPFHFDLSILDLFVSAAAGATIVLIPEAVTKVPASMSGLMEKERLTVWYSVPFALINLLERGCAHTRDLSSLRWVLFAGEQMPPEYLVRLQDLLPAANFANLYGPTETNVCMWYRVSIEKTQMDRIPIGGPASGAEILVVNAGGDTVDRVEKGELLVRGPSVMAGYWNASRADEAARGAVFGVGDPYYCTGDLVCQMADGNYLFLGRKDRQGKGRGYRVELEEIQSVLAS